MKGADTFIRCHLQTKLHGVILIVGPNILWYRCNFFYLTTAQKCVMINTRFNTPIHRNFILPDNAHPLSTHTVSYAELAAIQAAVGRGSRILVSYTFKERGGNIFLWLADTFRV
jgi:hypothetical protein